MPIMLRYLPSVLAALLATLSCLYVASRPASANISLVVWPTKMDLTIDTGHTSTQEISMQNTGDEPSRVRVYAMDFSVDREGNSTFYEPGHES